MKAPVGRMSRRLRRCCLCVLLPVLGTVPPSLGAAPAVEKPAVPTELRACGEGDGFPPFTYATPENGVATGFHVEVMHSVLAQSQRRLHVDLLPWARCVALAARGRYDLILDVSDTAMRKRDFALPRHSYTLTSIGVYRRSAPIPPLRTLADLLPLSRCEILGWDYSSAGLPAEVPAAGQPPTIEAAAKMLRAGRCDVLLYDAELMGAAALLGRPEPLPDDEFARTPLQWVGNIRLYAGVSRALPYRDALVQLLDEGLARFQASDEAKRLRAKYRLP